MTVYTKLFTPSTGMMHDVFDRIVSPQRAVSFDRLPPEEAYKRHPELRSAYQVLASAKRMAEQRFREPADQARFFSMYRTRISTELHQGNDIAAPTREQDRGRAR